MSEWQTVEKWSKNCLGKTITFIGFCYTFYSSSSNMWTATTSSSLTFAQLGLDVTHSRSWFLLLCWRASDVVFICLAFFFLNASKLHFSCSFYSRRWIIKATYWISKVCLWKTRLTRTAEVEELLKILVRLWRTFFPHSFPLHLCEEELIHLFFSGAVVKEKEAEVENQMPGGHHTMEFFEMCAALITQLAR